MSQRTALIIIIALVISAAAGILAFLAGSKPQAAILTGGSALAVAVRC